MLHGRYRRANRRRLASILAMLWVLQIAQPAHAWFGWSLPYFVFDAQRFANQVRSVQTELQWISSVKSNLAGDVKMLQQIRYSNISDVMAGLERLESLTGQIDLLNDAPTRLDDLVDGNWPVSYEGTSAERATFDAARQDWLAQERESIGELRAVQNDIAREMPAVRDRIDALVRESNDFASADAGLTTVLQARTQLHGELSSELAKLQALCLARAAIRSERIAREQSELARSQAVGAWLSRTEGGRAPVQPSRDGRAGYLVSPVLSPVPEPAGGLR